MKKNKLLIVMMICLFCFTGCMRFNTTIQIKSNGKADVSMLIAAKSDAGSGQNATDSYDDLKNKGWEVESYNEDGYVGMLCTKKNLELEDLGEQMGTSEEDTMIMDSNDFKITKKGLVYSFDWDYQGADEEADSEYVKSIENAGGYMTFTLKVPMKAKSSNATTVSDGGRTLEWNLLALKPEEGIHAEFVVINWPIVIAIIIGIVLIIAIIVTLIKSSNNNKIPVAQYQQPMQPQYPNPDQQFYQQPQQPGQQFYQQPQQPGQQFYQQPQQPTQPEQVVPDQQDYSAADEKIKFPQNKE